MTFQYRSEIDGLRGVAVLAVILFHAGYYSFSGGYVGVDIFFVISGYLITSIVLDEIEGGQFKFINFYEKRLRRLVPVLYVVLLCSLPFVWLFSTPEEIDDFASSLIATILYGSNFFFYLTTGYFEAKNELKPLLHTWSLAVEEQFYILFPIFLVLIIQYMKKWAISILFIAFCISLYSAEYYSERDPSLGFYMLPTRCWEILLGSLASCIKIKNSEISDIQKIRNEALSFFGIALIIIAIYFFNKNTPNPSYLTLLPAFGTFLIICFSSQTYIGICLSFRPLVLVGLISYSAYLFHQPIFAFARQATFENVDGLTQGVLILICLFISFITWNFIEKNFRNKSIISRKIIIYFWLLGGFIFMLIGVNAIANDGFKEYLNSNRVSEKEVLKSIANNAKLNLSMYDNGECIFWDPAFDVNFIRRFKKCAAKYGAANIVFGDSHAMNVYNSLALNGYDNFLVGISQGGCRPHNNYKHCFYNKFNEFVLNNKSSISKILFHQSGSYFIKDENGDVDSSKAYVDGSKITFDRVAINKDIDYLNGLSSIVPTVWIGPYTEARINFRDTRKIAVLGWNINLNSINNFKNLESILQDELSSREYFFKYISLLHILNIDIDSLKMGNCITFRDEDHFSRCGEQLFGKRIKATLKSIR